MIVVQINATGEAGSTGRICTSISRILTERGTENYVLYCLGSNQNPSQIKYTDSKSVKLSAAASRFFGNWGFEGGASTRRLIKKLDEIKPDIIHLHNIHSHACDLSMLFNWIKKKNIRLFWTFHDCWAFTGYCMHYDMIQCEKWKTECFDCPQKKEYSWFFDKSRQLYNKKKRLFSGLDLTIVTPSRWMANQVKESFLRDYPVKVINNGVDLEIFRPVDSSDFKEKYGLQDKRIVLAVAFGWSEKKGIDVLRRIANKLDSSYRLVIVGLDNPEGFGLPDSVITIPRTHSAAELAKIYSAADVLVNPTREENFPTVNLESVACGTPVVTFNTGGSPETIGISCGSVVEKNDCGAMLDEIIRICTEKPFTAEMCRECAGRFDKNDCFSSYIELYQK